MAYNTISGTLIAADKYIPGDLVVGNIVSGNLSTSDGADVINVPRVSNATNNSLITNVGGDANDLTCESNLTFDGSTLNVVGDISASVGVSASIFIGDGSQLTNLPGGGGGGAAAQGPDYSLQFTTGSGGISGSADLIFSASTLQIGGGLKLSRRRITATSYMAAADDYYIGVDTSAQAGLITINLPSASVLLNGQTYVLKDEGGDASSKNVTISASAPNTIDGQTTIVLESSYASIQLYCNGVNKYFIC